MENKDAFLFDIDRLLTKADARCAEAGEDVNKLNRLKADVMYTGDSTEKQAEYRLQKRFEEIDAKYSDGAAVARVPKAASTVKASASKGKKASAEA